MVYTLSPNAVAVGEKAGTKTAQGRGSEKTNPLVRSTDQRNLSEAWGLISVLMLTRDCSGRQLLAMALRLSVSAAGGAEYAGSATVLWFTHQPAR